MTHQSKSVRVEIDKMNPTITAIGTAHPPHREPQEQALTFMSHALELSAPRKRLYRSLYKSTGIKHRYTVLEDYTKSHGELAFFPNDPSQPFPGTGERMLAYKKYALPLALSAIDNCLNQLDHFDKNSITHLIAISCTGMYAPGLDIDITLSLDLPTHIHRTAINFMGCYGVFNGLKAAYAFCQSQPNAKVLLVSVELCTLHFQKNTALHNMISSAIFADGAGAMLIESTPSNPNNKALSLIDFQCDIIPNTQHEMAWDIGNSGFDMILTAYVSDAIRQGIAQFMQKLLNRQKIKFSDIDLYATHPGGTKILEACEEALSISQEQNRYAREILENYGNMSSATVIFVLKALWEELGQTDHGKHVFSCAFGPGLTLESMLLKVI